MQAPAGLKAEVDGGLPAALSVGHGTYALLRGSCSADGRRVRSANLVLDGQEQDLGGLIARSAVDRGGRRWWALAELPGVDEPRSVAVELDVRIGWRERARTALGRVELDPGWSPPTLNFAAAAERGDGSVTGALSLEPKVAVCIATDTPNLRRLGRRIESLESQAYENWHCLICDTGSPPGYLRRMRQLIDGSSRFTLFREEGVGLYGGLEQALMRIPADAPYVVLTDGVGRWAPDFLGSLLAGLEPESSAVVTKAPRDRGLAPIAFGRLPQSTTLFRRELLKYVVPLPPVLDPDAEPHRWIALVARAVGGISHVEVRGSASLESPAAQPNDDPGDGHLEQLVSTVVPARILEARVGEYLTRHDRRQVQRIASARSRIRLWLAARPEHGIG